tara:strand:- start:113 stop:868 length:756 start_codon:yes stop_codon:yes gene_type:complete
MTKLKSKLLWVQYTPGSGGRMLLICCTSSDAVGDWIENPLPDPVEFTKKHFCSPVSNQHMSVEPQTPYDIGWYTRNEKWTRGDDLTHQEVDNFIDRDPISVSHKGKYLANVWQKTYVPDWFRGQKLVTILNDPDSRAWLLQRRKEIFYEWNKNTVEHLRYKVGGGAPIKSYYKLFPTTQHLFEYTDKDKFVLDEFNKENINSEGEGVNITLSTLLNGNMDIVWDKIDNYLGKPLDRQWCNKVTQTWRERWH